MARGGWIASRGRRPKGGRSRRAGFIERVVRHGDDPLAIAPHYGIARSQAQDVIRNWRRDFQAKRREGFEPALGRTIALPEGPVITIGNPSRPGAADRFVSILDRGGKS